jgi:hypothetical protein
MGIEEGEDLQAKDKENILNKIIEEMFSNLEKVIGIHIHESFRTPNRQNQKRASPHHIIVQTLGTQNKKRTLRAARAEHQVIHKANPSEKHEISQQNL